MRRDRKGNVAGFARFQRDPLKTLQLFYRLRNRTYLVTDIQLYGFIARACARIGNLYGNLRALACANF
jgi:hypothetical protein